MQLFLIVNRLLVDGMRLLKVGLGMAHDHALFLRGLAPVVGLEKAHVLNESQLSAFVD